MQEQAWNARASQVFQLGMTNRAAQCANTERDHGEASTTTRAKSPRRCLAQQADKTQASVPSAPPSGELLAHDHHHPFTLCMKLQGNETRSLVCDVCSPPKEAACMCSGPCGKTVQHMHARALSRDPVGGRSRYSRDYSVLLRPGCTCRQGVRI